MWEKRCVSVGYERKYVFPFFFSPHFLSLPFRKHDQDPPLFAPLTPALLPSLLTLK